MDLTYGAASIRTTADGTQHVRYQEYTRRVEASGKCRCGKRRKRAETLTETTSPFNKDPDTGLPKTAQQVRESLAVKAEAWVPDFTCNSHDWASLTLRVVGTAAQPETVYTLGYRTCLQGGAIRDGVSRSGGSDDFRLVLLDGDDLIAMTDARGEPFDWTPETYAEECAEVAECLGLRWAK